MWSTLWHLYVKPCRERPVFPIGQILIMASPIDMNHDGVAEVLAGNRESKTLQAGAGTLVMFRGRNAMHRVTPVVGDITRMLVVLAYNSTPGVALSESARMTFYGRL